MKQGDYVYAWNNKYPSKKVYTRFLHELDHIKPAFVCVTPSKLDGYDTGNITLTCYDSVTFAEPSTTPFRRLIVDALLNPFYDRTHFVTQVFKLHEDISLIWLHTKMDNAELQMREVHPPSHIQATAERLAHGIEASYLR